jgi:hypothetical protein
LAANLSDEYAGADQRGKETIMSTEITTNETAKQPKAKRTKKEAAKSEKGSRKSPQSTKSKGAGKSKYGSKKKCVLELLHRKDGATTAEIAKATAWQNHTIRGFISGTIMTKWAFRSSQRRTRPASARIGSPVVLSFKKSRPRWAAFLLG